MISQVITIFFNPPNSIRDRTQEI
ncbi:MAG TPA: hypothetical protein DCZ88_13085 [Pseudanabaena sp.]|nr:hypothetical protein [Pseudanabaena sp.]